MIALALALALQAPAPDAFGARVERGRALWLRGQRAAAARVFDSVVDAAAGARRLTSSQLTAVGTAARFLSATDPAMAREALRAYDRAIAADSANLAPRIALGELFLERYNGSEARATFAAVLRIAPTEPRALLGMARVARFEGSAGASALVARSLAADSNLVPARVLLAELHLEGENTNGAALEAQRALGRDPASVEAFAVLAAARLLEDDTAGSEQAISRALGVDPTGRVLFITLAEVTARNRRYAEAARFARRAVQLDPQSWRGWALLGINQLRLGEMPAGRVSLERAFRGDPFDLWTKNTLDLLDTLERYDTLSSPRFRFAIDRRESALLMLYAAPLAEEAYDRLAARYGIRPPAPVRVELFPNHADFSVRTVGLAGLGALGVSFGAVIAMDAPSARRQGTFSWGSTLWHEIAHVFHMTLSGYRVPRWLTEGLAVLEERRARPGWGDDASAAFLGAYQAGNLLPVSRLNDGFVRPAYPEQVSFSYYQASLACELIEEQFGADAPVRMLRAYGAGRRTHDVIREVLGVPPDSLDARFDAWFRRRFAEPLAALAASDTARATAALVRARRGVDDYDGLLRLAAAREAAGDTAGTVSALDMALYAWPYAPGVHQRLAVLARRMRRFDLAIRERRAIVALAPADRAEALYQLALDYMANNDVEPARRATVAALEVAPGFARAQDLLLDIHARRRP